MEEKIAALEKAIENTRKAWKLLNKSQAQWHSVIDDWSDEEVRAAARKLRRFPFDVEGCGNVEF